MSRNTHTCPRRVENGTEGVRNKDRYRKGHGIIGQARGCTYCGSMSPEDFLAACHAGAELGPTDKSYKVYVKGGKGDGPNGAKFYFQHLTQLQRGEFIQLLNDKKLNIGYPGRFYVLPYFAVVKA